MNATEIINQLYRGGILQIDLESKTKYILEIMGHECSIAASYALLIAAAKQFDFKNDISGWLDWTEKTFGFNSSYRSHLYAIGKMLLEVQQVNLDLYQQLFKIDKEKLLSLSRLKICDLQTFCKRHNVAALNRDQVRELVNNWPGVKAAAGGTVTSSNGKHQPDLFDSIETLFEKTDADFEALGKSKNFDESKACRFAFTSMGLLTSSMTYWSNHGLDDPETAEVIEKGLRDFADNIKTMRKKCA